MTNQGAKNLCMGIVEFAVKDYKNARRHEDRWLGVIRKNVPDVCADIMRGEAVDWRKDKRCRELQTAYESLKYERNTLKRLKRFFYSAWGEQLMLGVVHPDEIIRALDNGMKRYERRKNVRK